MNYNKCSLKIGEYLYIKGRIGWKGLKKSEYLEDSNYRIINGDALEVYGINWNKCGHISKERYNESPEIILKEQDILISKDGTIGKIGYVMSLDIPTTVASGIFVIRNERTDIIDTDFLYYYFKSQYFKSFIAARTEGSVIPHLYQRDFVEMQFPLFDLRIQKKMSYILKIIDSKIDLNNIINENLQALSQLLFKQWFVDFDFLNEVGLPYKSSCGEMVDSELGKIPKEWKVGTLNIIGNFKNGKGIKEELRTGKGNNFIFGSNGIIGKTNEILQHESCIVVGRVGAYCGSIRLTLKPCWITDNAIIASSVEKENLPYLYICLLRLSLRDLAGGSAQPLINQNILNNIKIILPPSNLVEKYSIIVFSLMQKIEINIEQNAKLNNLRDTLLPKLMNGEINLDNLKINL
ncbi:restriction endonuclease subunit S [Clostridium sp. CF012]|uniref:restriction endonuclease subunit S n=1 Tax=Clostridium sp. CF012 TaxID=2843319 RepID=UPI001C0BEA08|nr:restriction endonuclease subunit S [Clostridium sp. CF012]MBU3145985.1 restriction endonuclease subunit S [Clostridium sp. CF012]